MTMRKIYSNAEILQIKENAAIKARFCITRVVENPLRCLVYKIILFKLLKIHLLKPFNTWHM